jgi:hypothetical protein
MRFANSPRALFLLALSAVLATSVRAQDHPNIQPNAVRDQLKGQMQGQSPQPQGAAKSQAQPAAKPAGPASTATKAPMNSAAAAQAPAKAKGSTTAKTKAATATTKKEPAKPTSAEAPKPAEEKPTEEKVSVVRRDPFETLLNKARAGDAAPENLPPGKAGLIVGTLRIDGIVRGPNGMMIAIVSNPQQRVYFLHDGDKLYDGSVEKISLDAVTFREIGKDAFGKPLEREVAKRLYPSPGEQQ